MADSGIGYFDSETEQPALDEATVCAACGRDLTQDTRPALALMIFCQRWPLGTFFRVHQDEVHLISREVYHELTCRALEMRARLEKDRKTAIPSIFLNAFKGETT